MHPKIHLATLAALSATAIGRVSAANSTEKDALADLSEPRTAARGPGETMRHAELREGRCAY